MNNTVTTIKASTTWHMLCFQNFCNRANPREILWERIELSTGTYNLQTYGEEGWSRMSNIRGKKKKKRRVSKWFELILFCAYLFWSKLISLLWASFLHLVQISVLNKQDASLILSLILSMTVCSVILHCWPALRMVCTGRSNWRGWQDRMHAAHTEELHHSENVDEFPFWRKASSGRVRHRLNK